MSYVRNEEARRIAMTDQCPVCGVEAGAPCIDSAGEDLPGYHVVRLSYAKDPKRYAHLLETRKPTP